MLAAAEMRTSPAMAAVAENREKIRANAMVRNADFLSRSEKCGHRRAASRPEAGGAGPMTGIVR
jgi:hypothetical protein